MTTIMPSKENEKPPGSGPRPARPWKVAVLANIKEHDQPLPPDVPPDAGADFDYIETINHIRAALETDGHKTVFIQADRSLPYALKEAKPDICFNIAEGLGGDAREAQVPALLEMLRIPYTGSRVLTNAISLDKTLTKRIWRDRRLPVAPFQEFTFGDEPLRPELKFPLFVKPAREGTGMGVDARAIVNNEPELRERVEYVIRMYNQPALVEVFLPGREFTVGILGRYDTVLYSRRPEWYDKDGFLRLPILELDSSRSVTPGVYGIEAKAQSVGTQGAPEYICPAPVDPDLMTKLHHFAYRAHIVLGALDVSRTDFRLDADGNPRLLEINTLPGLTPGYSDLCIQADAHGISYEDLLLEILYLGASRFGLLQPRELPTLPPIKKKTAPLNGTSPDVKPAEAKSAESKPAESKPAESKPAESKPAESKPAESKPAESKPAESKPAESKPAEAIPAAAKPGNGQPKP
jgi:D-alanine-D-alanine ligase